ncbi:MAG: modification methylase, HemK family [Bryobacterales bacterium]|nr:modification methylase, HemK family [Bryobacterales bacterium]
MPFLDIRTALRQGTELLSASRTEAPRLTAEVLLCHALDCERAYLFAHPEQELRQVEWLHYGRYLHERIQGKPTQYIMHAQEFYGRKFRVTRDVLIPRPETEHLIEAVLPLGARRIIDVGCGSGAIAITLALETATPVISTDISLAALAVAAANAKALGARVDLVACDLLAALGNESADLVVSNPPYVSTAADLPREVRHWEPAQALFAGEDGLAIYRRLIPDAARVLAAGGWLALELGFDSLAGVQKMLVCDWRDIRVTNDLAGIARVLVCQKAS